MNSGLYGLPRSRLDRSLEPPPLSVYSDPDLLAYIGAIQAISGSISMTDISIVYALIADLKNYGLWTKLIDVSIYAGDNLATALVKLKMPAGVSRYLVNTNFVEADYTRTTGLKGNGSSKYLRSGIIPSTHCSINDAHFGFYSRTNGACLLGIYQNDGQVFDIESATGGNSYFDSYASNQAGGRITIAGLSGSGHILWSRTASNALAAYRNGSSAGTNGSTPIGSLPTTELYYFALNTGSPSNYTSNYLAFNHVGTGLSSGDASTLYTIVQAFQTSMGRQV